MVGARSAFELFLEIAFSFRWSPYRASNSDTETIPRTVLVTYSTKSL